ncbi:MAG: hypothetical protein ACLFV7_12690 [Phycisphaerae bacterium]
MRREEFLTVMGALLLVAATATAGQSENLAEVKTSTFLGGKGTEWFTGAAFPGDDSIVVVGVSLDPDLTLRGVTAKVLGTDAPARKAPAEFRRLALSDTGKIDSPDADDLPTSLDGGLDSDLTLKPKPSKEQIEKRQAAARKRLESVPRTFRFAVGRSVEKQDVYARLVGNEPSATGFVARFDGDLGKVRSLHRLPRAAGTIHSVVMGKDGAVYIAGAATDRIGLLCDDRRTESIEQIPAPGEDPFPFGHVYVARLSKDLSKVLWVRDLKAWSYAPKLTALDNGNVAMLGPGYLVYDPSGKLVGANYIKRKRVVSGSAVCPVTGRYTRVGDWMSPTGREPYRCPRLLVLRPDGSIYKYLLGWRGPFFAPKHFHLVADSAVRRSVFDSKGNLYYSTWSHGGNNCMGRRPYDPYTRIPNAMNTVGSSTYCFVVKLDPQQNVLTSTLWTSAGNIQTLDVACDQSVVWAGRGNVTPNLPNSLRKSRGNLLVVTEPNLGTYRFISSMPAVGTRVALGGCSERINEWAFASGKVNGRPMLLCLSGAVAEETSHEGTTTPPLESPVQKSFGGGLMDGFAVLMDLTPKTELAYKPPVPERKPRPFKPYDGPRRLWPTEGQTWKIGTEDCVTVTVTFRDANDEMWPSFFMGRGVAGGTFTYGTKEADANFTLDCPTLLQQPGLQHQRVLGQLVGAPQKMPDGVDPNARVPKMKLHVTGMSAWEETGRKYGNQEFPVGKCTVSGTLEFNGRQIPFKDAPCRASFSYPYKEKNLKYPAPTAALPSMDFTMPGKALGLEGPLAKQNIRVHVAWEAISQVKPEKIEDSLGPPPKLKDANRVPSIEDAAGI